MRSFLCIEAVMMRRLVGYTCTNDRQPPTLIEEIPL